MRKSTFLLSIGACVLLMLSISVVHAQEATPQDTSENPSQKQELSVPKTVPPTGINLTVSPVFINLTTDPGEAVKSQIFVINNNNFREYLAIDIYKYSVGAGGQRLSLQPAASNDPFRKWVSFSEQKFAVESREKKTISFTVTPPRDAELGYYYAFAVKRINEVKGNKQPAIASVPGVPVILEVKSPNAKQELQLIDFTTDKLVYEYLPATFRMKVKNTGNIHVVPYGSIFIDSGSDKDVAILPANPGRNNALPNLETELISRWDDGFAVRMPKADAAGNIQYDDKGRAQYTTKWDFTKADKFRIGKYTAHMLLVYDNGERDVPLEARVSFWIIPWKLLGAAGVIVILVLLGLKSIIGSSFKKVRRK